MCVCVCVHVCVCMYIVFLSRSVNEHFLCLQLTGSSHVFFTSFNELTLRMVSVQFPLCLEDMCMINIFFRLDEYPIEILALLPRAIRQRLYRGLSPADRLHYSSTRLFDDVDRGYHHDKRYFVEIIFSKSRFMFQFLEVNVFSCLKVDSDTIKDQMHTWNTLPSATHLFHSHWSKLFYMLVLC